MKKRDKAGEGQSTRETRKEAEPGREKEKRCTPKELIEE